LPYGKLIGQDERFDVDESEDAFQEGEGRKQTQKKMHFLPREGENTLLFP
jgi:hypothetical protein